MHRLASVVSSFKSPHTVYGSGCTPERAAEANDLVLDLAHSIVQRHGDRGQFTREQAVALGAVFLLACRDHMFHVLEDSMRAHDILLERLEFETSEQF